LEKTKKNKPGTLEERIKRISHPKKKRFLSLWRSSQGNITRCSKATRIDRITYYNWIKSDPVFAELVGEAQAELNDEMRSALIKKGRSGDMTAIIFYLKSRHPDFKPNYGSSLRLQDADRSLTLMITRGKDEG